MAKQADPVGDYARAVLSGKILAGKPVRKACQRHLDDLKQAKKKGLVWKTEEAQEKIDFFETMLLLEDGHPFKLEPAEEFIVGSLFGWYNADGTRRFRTAYIEAGKGTGKTPLAAGIGIIGLLIDGESASEVYTAAVTHDQAGIVFKDATRMVKESPELSALIDCQVASLTIPSQYAVFRPVSSEHKSLDGKRVHMAIIDELHEHQSPLVANKMRAGTKNRKNALIFEITNSGYDRKSVCWTHHEYSLKVLNGLLENESWFAYVCSLDPCQKCEDEGKTQPDDTCPDCDDWRDEKVWIKTNPLLGVTVSKRYLREQVEEAKGIPVQANIVKRLNFNIWTEQSVRWMPMDQWDACDLAHINPIDLQGESCFAGLDLASTTDIAALVLLFPPNNEREWHTVLPFFWVPAERVAWRLKHDAVDYRSWIDAGLIKTTEGNVIDYDEIRAEIGRLGEQYNIREIAIDRWNSTQLQTQLMGDGFTVAQFGQGFASMTAPTKELLNLVLSQDINHGGNLVMRWMASNVSVKTDPAGNLKPDKEKSGDKIDGIVSLVMALGRAMVQPDEDESVYSQRGLLSA